MRFLEGNSYSQEIERLFLNNSRLDVAVAFFGIDVFPLINESSKPIRIICNLESGACNPYLIKKVLKLANIEVKTNRRLHAKTLIQDECVVLGSANISANGMSLEGKEIEGWIETGVCTDSSEVIRDSKEWFKNLWESSTVVTVNSLENFIDNWRLKQGQRVRSCLLP